MVDDDVLKKQLIYNAPYAESLNKLILIVSGVSRATIFRYLRHTPAVKIEIMQLLGTKGGKSSTDRKPYKKGKIKKVKHEGQSIESRIYDPSTGQDITDITDEVLMAANGIKKPRERKPVTVTVEVPVIPKDSRRTYSEEGRTKAFKAVCDLIRTGMSIQSACDVVGIPYRSFHNWKTPTYTTFDQANVDMYREAMNAHVNTNMEAAQIKASQVLLAALQTKVVVKTTKIGRVGKDGKVKPHTIVQREEEIQPNVQIAKWIAAKTDPVRWGDAADREYHRNSGAASGVDSNPYALRAMSLEDLQTEKATLLNRIAVLKQKQEGDMHE